MAHYIANPLFEVGAALKVEQWCKLHECRVFPVLHRNSFCIGYIILPQSAQTMYLLENHGKTIKEFVEPECVIQDPLKYVDKSML